MISKITNKLFFFAAAMLLAFSGAANADAIYNVAINGGTTTAIALFQLIPGGAPGLNQATISGFSGAALTSGSCPASVGDCSLAASGDLNGTLSLDDSAGTSQFAQFLNPNGPFTFVLSLTTNPQTDPAASLDGFSFTLLDAAGNLIVPADGDPNTFANYFSIDIDTQPNVNIYTSAATVTPAVSAVPEPGSLALIGSGILPWLHVIRRRYKRI